MKTKNNGMKITYTAHAGASLGNRFIVVMNKWCVQEDIDKPMKPRGIEPYYPVCTPLRHSP